MPDLLWIDGFEIDRTNTSLALNYNFASNWPASISATTGRYGGFSLRSVADTATALSTSSLAWTAAASARLVYMGLGIRASSPGDTTLFGMVGGFNPALSWSVESLDSGSGTYELLLKDSDDITISTSDPISYGEWVYIEVSVMSQDAGAWSWRINDAVIASGTSDFLPSGVPQGKAALYWPSLPSPGYVEYDDWYVTETGFYGSTFIVEGLQVNADGATSDWSPSVGGDHYLMVDDPGDSDGDATYMMTDTNGHEDLFLIESLNLIQGSIVAVRYQVDARNDDATNRDLTPDFIIGGTPVTGTSQTVVGEVYQRYWEMFEDNPDSASPWVKGDFNLIEVGMAKGLAANQTVLILKDEDQTVGHIYVDDMNLLIPLIDEDNVTGEMDTHNSNTQLAIFDEAAVEGDFDLTVI